MIKNQDQGLQLSVTQKNGSGNIKKFVERKNTEVLGAAFGTTSQSKIGRNTMQRVMDIQEKLNVTIQKEDGQKPSHNGGTGARELDRESGGSALE